MNQEQSGLTVDVGDLIDQGRWGLFQKLATMLVALTIILDGFDNQVLGFALPAIIKEWGVARGAFAPVVALGLIGMSVGTVIAGVAGDRIGRRWTLICSVVVFGLATAAISRVHGLQGLAILRFIAGAGIGGAMPNAATLAAEYTPTRRRALAVTCTIVCVPLGGMVGGVVAGRILPTLGWRALFLIGGAAPLVIAGVLILALPESPRYLARLVGRSDDLVRALRRLGHAPPPGARMIDMSERQVSERKGLGALFDHGYRRDTLALWAAFFCTLVAVYTVFSWLPTLLSGQGLDLKTASSGLAYYNFGGVLGALFGATLIGVLGSRWVVSGLALGGVASAALLIVTPIQPHANHLALIAGLGLHGFFVNGVQTTLYALAAHVYLTDVRASGTGAAVAVGRIGAIISAFAGAVVLAAGASSFFALLAVALAGSCLAVLALRGHIPKGTALAAASH